jgi:S-adenosylmethionine hydrolase
MTANVITLLSDFGLKDPYVAEMKAVILDKCPEATIVDISHTVDRFDVRMAGFILAAAASHFPMGTVHVAVVDPGVGTERRAIIVETRHGLFVGPDNGILMLAASKAGLSHVYAIENRRYMLPRVAVTFHGRDIFAPVAAHLALGVAPSDFGKEIRDYTTPKSADAVLEKDAVLAEVVHVDNFGNVVTNVSLNIMKRLGFQEKMGLEVEVGQEAVRLKLCSTYGAVAKGTPLVVLGSHDFLEIAVNQGNAAEHFGVKRGDRVRVRRGS